MIHVVGTPFTGYCHEVRHYWDMTKSGVKYTFHLLGETDATNIVDAEIADPNKIGMEVTKDLNKADKFENRASRLRAPGIVPQSLRPTGTVSQQAAGWAKDIPGAKRCQEWTSELIDDLVRQKLLPDSALAKRDEVRAARPVPA